MTQITGLLAISTVFIGLWTSISTFDSQGGDGGSIMMLTACCGCCSRANFCCTMNELEVANYQPFIL